jgi:hypothetical protein
MDVAEKMKRLVVVLDVPEWATHRYPEAIEAFGLLFGGEVPMDVVRCEWEEVPV